MQNGSPNARFHQRNELAYVLNRMGQYLKSPLRSHFTYFTYIYHRISQHTITQYFKGGSSIYFIVFPHGQASALFLARCPSLSGLYQPARLHHYLWFRCLPLRHSAGAFAPQAAAFWNQIVATCAVPTAWRRPPSGLLAFCYGRPYHPCFFSN